MFKAFTTVYVSALVTVLTVPSVSAQINIPLPDGFCYPILCTEGSIATDTDGDGCGDACLPRCTSVQCGSNLNGTDTNGDGCADTCSASANLSAPLCPPANCPGGSTYVDANNDGCYESCDPACPILLCVDGSVAVDTDNNGCGDSCKQPLCPQDLNADNLINISDLVQVVVSYGKKTGSQDFNSVFDVNRDGIVGIADIVIVARKFGQSCV